ncbi:unnamed protein product [Rotaria sp. Silwood2]|nr:unnamed protein product [Rotaria sp. Silwood2]
MKEELKHKNCKINELNRNPLLNFDKNESPRADLNYYVLTRLSLPHQHPTNQGRLHVQHFFPPLSSNEYQQLLYDGRSTEDDDDEDIHQVLDHSINREKNIYHNTSATTENEV